MESGMTLTERLIVESRRCIFKSYLAVGRLCASVARTDEAIAKSLTIIQQYKAAVQATADQADEPTGDLRMIIYHHPASLPAATFKKASDNRAQQIAARLREVGVSCEVLNPPVLH